VASSTNDAYDGMAEGSANDNDIDGNGGGGGNDGHGGIAMSTDELLALLDECGIAYPPYATRDMLSERARCRRRRQVDLAGGMPMTTTTTTSVVASFVVLPREGWGRRPFCILRGRTRRQ
jgi:hypothetical protein